MRKYIGILMIFLFLTGKLFGQDKSTPQTESIPQGFVSDGCTMFPDGDYRDCCLEHDEKYFRGGSWKERWRADNELRKCVKAKTGFYHKPISILMWLGVRAFGVSWLPTSFRWGFGKEVNTKTQKEKNK